jgi:hypothetical protein
MASDEIKADYEQLEQVASRFANQAQMNSEVLPACQRLINVLHDAAQTTKDISSRMKTAEDEASAPFRSTR